MIGTQCPYCQKVFYVKEELAGKLGSCPQCRQQIQVPASSTASNYAGAPQTSPPSVREGSAPAAPPPTPVRRERSWDDDYVRPQSSRRRRNPRVRKRSRGRSDPASRGFLPAMVGLTVFAVLCSLAALLLPPIGFVVIVVGGLVCIISSFWFLGAAARDGAGPLLLCLFVPFYGLIYLINNFDELKHAFYLHLVGILVLVLGTGGLFLGSALWYTPDDITPESHRPDQIAHVQPGDPIVNPQPAAVNPQPPLNQPQPPIHQPQPPANQPQPPNVNPQPPVANVNQPEPGRGSSDEGLRAYFSFDEGEGSITRDASQSEIQGMVQGCQWVQGTRGNALLFNGTTDCVKLNFSPALTFDANIPFTICAWVKTTDRDGVIFSLRRIPERGTWDLISIRLAGGRLQCWVRHEKDPFFPPHITTISPINDGQWHHFALSRDVAGNLSLCIDGIQNGRIKGGLKGLPAGRIVTTHHCLGCDPNEAMGKNARQNSGRYQGILDELYVYGRVLSQGEINNLGKRR